MDLTLNEAEMLFSANSKVKEMAASGELAALHKRCADVESSIETGYLKVMDQLERVLT